MVILFRAVERSGRVRNVAITEAGGDHIVSPMTEKKSSLTIVLHAEFRESSIGQFASETSRVVCCWEGSPRIFMPKTRMSFKAMSISISLQFAKQESIVRVLCPSTYVAEFLQAS